MFVSALTLLAAMRRITPGQGPGLRALRETVRGLLVLVCLVAVLAPAAAAEVAFRKSTQPGR